MTETVEKKAVIGVWPTLIYDDGQAALRFLTEGLGFEKVAEYAGEQPGSIAHAELRWPGGGGVMVSSGRRTDDDPFAELAAHPASVYLVTDDPDALFGRAIGAGAVVIRPLEDTDYGSRGFTVRDSEGNLWSAGTYAGEFGR
jgi:uncharacterized glyoxalase superfamily protein PhnB